MPLLEIDLEGLLRVAVILLIFVAPGIAKALKRLKEAGEAAQPPARPSAHASTTADRSRNDAELDGAEAWKRLLRGEEPAPPPQPVSPPSSTRVPQPRIAAEASAAPAPALEAGAPAGFPAFEALSNAPQVSEDELEARGTPYGAALPSWEASLEARSSEGGEVAAPLDALAQSSEESAETALASGIEFGRSPAALRRAFLAAEVLGPPHVLRKDAPAWAG